MANAGTDISTERKFYDFPFGGLFGNSVIANVVEEIIADPDSTYTAEGLKDLTDRSLPRIRSALKYLKNIGLLRSVDSHKYTVDRKSKKYSALVFLAYAVSDDKDKVNIMDIKIMRYCSVHLKDKMDPQVRATATNEIYQKTSEATRFSASINSPSAAVA
jgi:hypothetical protein